MCGRLRHEKRASRLGDLVVISFGEKRGAIKWMGHAQSEKLDSFWLKNGGVRVQIHVDEFEEQGHSFKVPGGIIQGVGIRNDIIINGDKIGEKNTAKIVTRPAQSDFEKRIHHRWPLVYKQTSEDVQVYIFSGKDRI